MTYCDNCKDKDVCPTCQLKGMEVVEKKVNKIKYAYASKEIIIIFCNGKPELALQGYTEKEVEKQVKRLKDNYRKKLKMVVSIYNKIYHWHTDKVNLNKKEII